MKLLDFITEKIFWGVKKISKNQVCIVCGEEHGLDDIHLVEIKGKQKKICKGCATSIKGLV